MKHRRQSTVGVSKAETLGHICLQCQSKILMLSTSLDQIAYGKHSHSYHLAGACKFDWCVISSNII